MLRGPAARHRVRSGVGTVGVRAEGGQVCITYLKLFKKWKTTVKDVTAKLQTNCTRTVAAGIIKENLLFHFILLNFCFIVITTVYSIYFKYEDSYNIASCCSRLRPHEIK